jgi:hypothetical protein
MRDPEDGHPIIIDAIPSMAWSSRPDGLIEFVNRRWLARAFVERLARGATLAFAVSKKVVRAYLEGGIRKADVMVDEIAPALFDSADMHAGVQGLLEHGPCGFRDKVVFHGR